jgi:hypothetical protein
MTLRKRRTMLRVTTCDLRKSLIGENTSKFKVLIQYICIISYKTAMGPGGVKTLDELLEEKRKRAQSDQSHEVWIQVSDVAPQQPHSTIRSVCIQHINTRIASSSVQFLIVSFTNEPKVVAE